VSEPDPRLKLALDRAWASLDVQRDLFESIRGRAAALLSAGSLVTGLLGVATITKEGHVTNGWAWAGLGAFVVLVVDCLYILAPIRRPVRWNFPARPPDVKKLLGETTSFDGMVRALHERAVTYYVENQDSLKGVLWSWPWRP
jgi:hypothetical protein